MALLITASFGPNGLTSREIFPHWHTRSAQDRPKQEPFGGLRTQKQGRGLGVQPPGRADKMAIATIRYSGGEGVDGGELKESEEMLTHRRGRLAKQKAGTSGSVKPPNPSHTRLGWGRGLA